MAHHKIENPGGAGTPHGANQIHHDLADFAAARARNQETAFAALAIDSDAPCREHVYRALRRRGIYARHGVAFVPLVASPDLFHRALELAPENCALDDVLCHLAIETRDGAVVEPGAFWPHVDADIIGQTKAHQGTVTVAVTVFDWLAAFRILPSGESHGGFAVWCDAVLAIHRDDAAVERLAWRVTREASRVNIIGTGRRQQKLAEALRRYGAAAGLRVDLVPRASDLRRAA